MTERRLSSGERRALRELQRRARDADRERFEAARGSGDDAGGHADYFIQGYAAAMNVAVAVVRRAV